MRIKNYSQNIHNIFAYHNRSRNVHVGNVSIRNDQGQKGPGQKQLLKEKKKMGMLLQFSQAETEQFFTQNL